MPFVEQPKTISNRPITSIDNQEDVGFAEASMSMIKTESPIYNLGIGMASFSKFPSQDGYNPALYLDGYEGYAADLLDAKSPTEMAFLKEGIDFRKKANQDFAMADGWGKSAAIGAMIATDPSILIPSAAIYKGAKTSETILVNGAKIAGLTAAIETGSEAILQANQVERTGAESLKNIAISTFVGGLLGGASGLLAKADFDSVATKLNDDLATPSPFGSSTASAAQVKVATTLEEEEIKGLTRMKKVMGAMPSFMRNPLFNLATSESVVARRMSEMMGDLSLVKNKNMEFKASEASIENLVKGYDTLKVGFYNNEKTLWQNYNKRISTEGVAAGHNLGTGKNGALTRREFNEAVYDALIHNDTHIIPEVQEYARKVRSEILDPIKKRGVEVGIFDDEMTIKTAESYAPRMPDRNKILANRTEFKKIVLDDLIQKRNNAANELEELKKSMTKTPTEELRDRVAKLKLKASTLDEELDMVAEQLIDRYTNATGGRLPYDHEIKTSSGGKPKLGARGSAKERVWDIEDNKIRDYVVRDVRDIVEGHIRTLAPDIEILKKFGTLDIENLKKEIQDDYNILRNKKVKDKKTGEMREQTNAELNKLSKRMKDDISDLEALYEKLRGIYAQPDDYSAPIHVLERSALALNYVRLLGDVVASSIPDLARPIMVHGFGRTYGKLLKSAMSDMKGLKLAKDEMLEIGTALDMTNSMTTLSRNNMDAYVPMTGKIDQVMQKTSAIASTINGMNVWTSTMKTFAGIMTQNRMLEGILEYAKTGKLGQKEIENLASHGIGEDLAKRIANQFEKHGETREVLKIANARNWDDLEAKELFRAAIRKQIDEIIVTPGLDKPLWMSRAGWKTIGQFKSFAFASTQRVMMAGMQQADANTYSGLVAMTFLGSMVYGWKSMLSGRDPSDDIRVWIKEGVDRSGVLGIFADVNNITEKLTRGRVGASALTGGQTMSRYASRNLAGTLMGPSFGLAQDVFQITGSAFSGDFKQTDTHKARQLLPFQNIPYIRGLFDSAEDAFNSGFGVE